MSIKLVLLDRDGTLIKDIGRPQAPEEVQLLPGVASALINLRELGYYIVVCTNQAAIGRKELTTVQFNEQNGAMRELLWSHGASIDRIYHCPHTPASFCTCRKPRPGMLTKALKDYKVFNRKACHMVGDKWADVHAGKAAGVQSHLIQLNSDGLHQLVTKGALYG